MQGQTIIGAAISGAFLFIAEKMELITHSLLHLQMPPIVMQAAQIFAWVMTGIAATVTVFNWWEKRKAKKQGKDGN